MPGEQLNTSTLQNSWPAAITSWLGLAFKTICSPAPIYLTQLKTANLLVIELVFTPSHVSAGKLWTAFRVTVTLLVCKERIS